MSSAKITVKAQKRTVYTTVDGRYTVAFPKMKFKIYYKIKRQGDTTQFVCDSFYVFSKEKMLLPNSKIYKRMFGYMYKVCLGSGGYHLYTEDSDKFFEKRKNFKIHKNKFIKHVAALFFTTKFYSCLHNEKYFKKWQNEGLQIANNHFHGILDNYIICWNKPKTWRYE